MREIFRSNNPVQLSYVQAQMGEQGIETIVLDQHTSFIEGSIGAIQQRLMVADDDYDMALRYFNTLKETL